MGVALGIALLSWRLPGGAVFERVFQEKWTVGRERTPGYYAVRDGTKQQHDTSQTNGHHACVNALSNSGCPWALGLRIAASGGNEGTAPQNKCRHGNRGEPSSELMPGEYNESSSGPAMMRFCPAPGMFSLPQNALPSLFVSPGRLVFVCWVTRGAVQAG